MAAYMASLRLLLTREDQVYLCGHGPKLENPQPLVRAMLTHRVGRESAVLGCLGDTPKNPASIVDLLYTELEPRIKPAAARSVLAHLLKLAGEGRAMELAEGWVAAS
jgi:glyoxylase-like metal-dependent hydrolase (beta-lactamase superfamily II)